jgi:hypothetical protein
MLTTIHVTETDIQNGKEGDCALCPIALSLKRYIDERYSVFVHDDSASMASFERLDMIPPIPLPQEAKAFIKAFDCFLPVAPFSFQLDIPEEFLK